VQCKGCQSIGPALQEILLRFALDDGKAVDKIMNEENGHFENDPIIHKNLESVYGQIIDKGYDGDNGNHKSDDIAKYQIIDLVSRKLKSGVVIIEGFFSRGAKHGGHRKKKRELGRRFSIQFLGQSAHNGRATSGGSRNHGQNLEKSNFQGGGITDFRMGPRVI